MKILHVYKTYFPDTQGGLEEAIRQICTNTRAFGVQSRVLVLSRMIDHEVLRIIDETEVYCYKLDFEIASCGFSWAALKAFGQHAEWADVIHYYFPWPFADVLHFAIRPKKPVLVTYVSDIVRQEHLMKIYRPLMRWFLGVADRIIATSPNHLASSPVLAAYKQKTGVIPLGLNKSSYPPLEPQLYQEMQVKYGQGFFLFIGVFRYYKGLSFLIESAANQAYNVVIVGKGKPFEVAELERQVVSLQADNIHFAGAVSDAGKVALLNLAAAVVLPSIHPSEAFGISLLEGAMFAKPMISTELGTGTTYINRHLETGLVVEPKNVLQLREAMQTLHENPELAKNLGAGAERRYQAIFTGAEMAKAYVHEYQHLLSKAWT